MVVPHIITDYRVILQSKGGFVAVTNGFQFGKQRTSFLLFRTLTMTADHGLIELIYIIIHVLIETYFVDLE